MKKYVQYTIKNSLSLQPACSMELYNIMSLYRMIQTFMHAITYTYTVSTVLSRAEEAVSGWVGSSEYICHMEQSKISVCNAC